MTLRSFTSEQETAYETRCRSLGIAYRPQAQSAELTSNTREARIEARRAKRQADRGDQAELFAVELGVPASDWQHLGWVRANAPEGITGEALKAWVESQVEPQWLAPAPAPAPVEPTEEPAPTMTAAEMRTARMAYDASKIDRLNGVDPEKYAAARERAGLPYVPFRKIRRPFAKEEETTPEPPISPREQRYRATMERAGVPVMRTGR